MESIIQVACPSCNTTFDFQTENVPYQTKIEPQQNLTMVEHRTYVATCPTCETKTTVVQPITRNLTDLEGLQNLQGNVKTVNVKGGPACLVMVGVFALIATIFAALGYFVVQGIGTLFSWF